MIFNRLSTKGEILNLFVFLLCMLPQNSVHLKIYIFVLFASHLDTFSKESSGMEVGFCSLISLYYFKYFSFIAPGTGAQGGCTGAPTYIFNQPVLTVRCHVCSKLNCYKNKFTVCLTQTET